jgi:hypothetical protein
VMTQPPFPDGEDFLRVIHDAEHKCAQVTLREISELGRSVPATYRALGDVFSLLYREASCQYGCDHSDHFFQRLTARAVNSALAAFRLTTFGYYDEALGLIRGIGEEANLLFLFLATPEALTRWRSLDPKLRWREFRPLGVRKQLEALTLRAPVDDSRYHLLSEAGTHLTPTTVPQALDEGRSTLGALFQTTGLMVCLNELAFAVAECAGCLSRFDFVGPRSELIGQSSELLLNVAGSLDLAQLRCETMPNHTAMERTAGRAAARSKDEL